MITVILDATKKADDKKTLENKAWRKSLTMSKTFILSFLVLFVSGKYRYIHNISKIPKISIQ